MREKKWFINKQGKTAGPLTTEEVLEGLRQSPLQILEYAWCEGLSEWVRLTEFREFESLLPPYPRVPFPSVLELVAARPEGMPKMPSTLSHAHFVRVNGLMEVQGHGKFDLIQMSENGALVQGKEAIGIGTQLKFKLICDALGSPLEMTGVVVRQPAEFGSESVVIEFTRVNPAHQRIIAGVILSSLEKKA